MGCEGGISMEKHIDKAQYNATANCVLELLRKEDTGQNFVRLLWKFCSQADGWVQRE